MWIKQVVFFSFSALSEKNILEKLNDGLREST